MIKQVSYFSMEMLIMNFEIKLIQCTILFDLRFETNFLPSHYWLKYISLFTWYVTNNGIQVLRSALFRNSQLYIAESEFWCSQWKVLGNYNEISWVRVSVWTSRECMYPVRRGLHRTKHPKHRCQLCIKYNYYLFSWIS